MNDNNQSFSNTPYKATGNLNTVIGNPNININSAVTSNIMEGNPSNSNFGNQQNINSVDFNQNSNLNSNLNSYDEAPQFPNENVQDSLEQNPVESFIAKTTASQNLSSTEVNTSTFTSLETDNSNFKTNNLNTDINKNTEFLASNENNNSVRYENAYETPKKNKPKKTVKIPNEFKTAIFVVLILLIILSCFDFVYDFFKDFWINR